MKNNKTIWLLIFGILIFSLTGCQPTAATSSPAPNINATEPQQTAPTVGAYPASTVQANPAAGAYPGPAGIQNAPAGTLNAGVGAYPAPQSGSSTIPWAQAEQMIMAGNVKSLVQTATLDVTLTLNTGETYKTTAPAADAAQKAITSCGDPCKNFNHNKPVKVHSDIIAQNVEPEKHRFSGSTFWAFSCFRIADKFIS